MSNTQNVYIKGHNKTNTAFKQVQSNLKGLDSSVRRLSGGLAGIAAASGVTVLLSKMVSGSIEAGREFEKLNRILSQNDMAFVRAESDRLGLSLSVSAEGYSKITAAAAGTSLQGEKTRAIFTGLNTAVAGLGLSADQSNGALRAFEQIISKGTVQAEELRGQLGERIPGAFQIAARAMGMTTAELNKQLELGKVMSDDFLPKFASELEKTYGGKALTGAQQLTAQQNRLSNAILEIQKKVSDSGFLDALTDSIAKTTELLKSDGAIAAAEAFGQTLAGIINFSGLLVTGLSNIYDIGKSVVDDVFNSDVKLLPPLVTLNSVVSLIGTSFEAWKAIFTDTELYGVALVRSLMIGAENVKYGWEVTLESIKFLFKKVFESIVEEAAKPLTMLRDGLDKAGFDSAAKKLDGFKVSIFGAGDATTKFLDKLDALEKQKDDNIKVIKTLTDEQADFVSETKKATLETKKLGDEVEDTTPQLKKLAESCEATKEELRGMAKYMREADKASDDLAKATGNDLLRSVEQLNVAFEQSQQKLKNQGIAFKQVEEYLTGTQGLIKGTTEYTEALEAMGYKVEEETSNLSKLWEQTTDSMYGAMENFFYEGLDGWDSFADSIKDTFKKLIASILAQWAASGIAGLFNGQGFSGFSFDNAFSGGISGIGGGGSGGGGGALSTLGGAGSIAGGASQISSGVDQIENGNTGAGLMNIVSGGSSVWSGASSLGLVGGGATTASGGMGALALSGGSSASGLAAGASLGAGAGASIAGTGGAAGAGLGGAAGGSIGASGGAAGGLGGVASAAGWIGLAIAADQLLLDGAIGDAGFSVWDERKRDYENGLEEIAKSQLSLNYPKIFLQNLFGGQGTDSLGAEQLGEVIKSLEAGRAEAIKLTESVNFLGGFNDETTFFQTGLDSEQASRASGLIQDRLGLSDVREIADGIIRLEDLGGSFEANSDRIMAEVLASVAEVEIGFTGLERGIVKNMGDAFIQIDKEFDKFVASGMDSTEAVTAAVSEFYGKSTEEANAWIENSGLTIDRFRDSFLGASGDVLSAVINDFGQAEMGVVSSFDSMSSAANDFSELSRSAANRAAESWGMAGAAAANATNQQRQADSSRNRAPSRNEQENTKNLKTLTNIATANSISNQPLFGT